MTNMIQKLATKTNLKRVLGAGALAAAMFAVATPKAEAQRVFFGVHVGGPRYFAPVPPPPAYYGYGYGYHYGPYGYRHYAPPPPPRYYGHRW
ncbi:hypothetical protein ACFQBQ_08625 [Granulicella cerasi]|uniref:Uncharacterized protein n=1 Tax=Granulicella cerasi TaxID=741063 RepID=A0ABW1Z866_9BACT|nr:hypothetical protein [Granulicella cerasi]